MGDVDEAIETLTTSSYYRLSGYWYPFRRLAGTSRLDQFYPGTTLADVVALYRFDATLRAMAFAQLSHIELNTRALLGHELGRIHETAHLNPRLLSSRAQGQAYKDWLSNYTKELERSREDFVNHHKNEYAGSLPTWAAVEIFDWGAMTRLFGFSPRHVQDVIAGLYGLSAPQLESWLRSLGIVRNICAHHGRLFNRVLPAPRLPSPGLHPALDTAGPFTRTFGQLSLIQQILKHRKVGNPRVLPSVLRAYPSVQLVPISHTGAPSNWSDSLLWT
ncbi:CAAX protease [Rathayibacter tritici]|uniref:CAAX protease n=1 Tax=Rathayibacter tritici TaxID=33888 RepID=A0A169C7R0_9MICO|nr:CAAX protease [Rathayibacter tritici]